MIRHIPSHGEHKEDGLFDIKEQTKIKQRIVISIDWAGSPSIKGEQYHREDNQMKINSIVHSVGLGRL